MTFDEAIAKVGTYLKNNDLSNSDNNDRFFYIILNDLRKEYAPTIEMKEYQYRYMQGSDSIVDVVGNVTVDGLLKEFFDENFWAPLTTTTSCKRMVTPRND